MQRELVSASFEALAESAPDAIVTIDEESIILFANPSLERVFGYLPSEVVGRSFTELIPARLRAAHRAGLARYLGSGERRIPWTGVNLPGLRKDGSEVPLEISFGEFTDDDGRRVFSGFMRDVSDRERHRRELEEAKALAEGALAELATVARVLDIALASGTYEGMLQELLHGLRQELGADEATVLLLDDATQELVVQQSDGMELDKNIRVPVGQGLAGKVVASGKSLAIEDLSVMDVRHPRLRDEIASLVAVPIRSDGRLIGVLHVGTRERRAFSQAHVRLLDLVAERMAGVLARTRLYQAERAARQAAEQAQRARDDVLSVVSHDLRNPVSTIAMSASLLRDAEITLTPEQRSKQLEIISRSAGRMNRLIQDLLDVARIEGGRLTVSCRPEDVQALANEATDSFREIAAKKAQTLECHVEPGIPAAHLDRDRILQVLSNFLSNAVKFSPQGGHIILRVSRRADGGVRFVVADDGPGIPEPYLEKVFSRFWQAKHTAHLGSGLGLAIAKGIVDAHRGRIWAESIAGNGATFSFDLPVTADCA